MNLNVSKNLFLKMFHAIRLAFCVLMELKILITALCAMEIEFLKLKFLLHMADASALKILRT